MINKNSAKDGVRRIIKIMCFTLPTSWSGPRLDWLFLIRNKLFNRLL